MEKGLLFSFFHLCLYVAMQRNRFHAGVNFKGQSHRGVAVGIYVIAVFIVLHGLWFICAILLVQYLTKCHSKALRQSIRSQEKEEDK